MIVTCEKCKARFGLDDNQVGPQGTKVRCSSCQHTFLVALPDDPQMMRSGEHRIIAGDLTRPPPRPRAVSSEAPTAVGANPMFSDDVSLDADADFEGARTGVTAVAELGAPGPEFGTEVTREFSGARPGAGRASILGDSTLQTSLAELEKLRQASGVTADELFSDVSPSDSGRSPLEPFAQAAAQEEEPGGLASAPGPDTRLDTEQPTSSGKVVNLLVALAAACFLLVGIYHFFATNTDRGWLQDRGQKPVEATRIEAVRAVRYATAAGHEVVVVTGEIRNVGDAPQAGLYVVTDLLDGQRRALARERAPVGFALADAHLDTLTGSASVARALEAQLADGASHVVAPGASGAFTAVFFDLPPDDAALTPRVFLERGTTLVAAAPEPAPQPETVVEEEERGKHKKRARKKKRPRRKRKKGGDAAP